MAVTSITLSDPDSGVSVPLRLATGPVDGITATTLDVAAPARAVVAERVGAHGQLDTTAYYTAAAVSLAMVLYPSSDGLTFPEDILDALAPLLQPGLRPVLIVGNDQWAGPRQITVRFDSMTKPVTGADSQAVQVSWVAPSAVWEDVTALTAVIGAFIPSATGLTWDVPGVTWSTAGIVWPSSTSPPASLVTNPGTIDTQWQAALYGPCTGPKIASDDGALEFDDGLVLAAGEYVLLDSAAHTAYRNGDPTQPSIGDLTYPAVWFPLRPGANNIRFYPSDAGPSSAAQLTWRPARPA